MSDVVEASWNVMAHAQKPDFVFRRNGWVHLNRRGRQFSRLLGAEVCASAVIMLHTKCTEVVWRVLATHSIRQFTLHFPSRALPCAITFQLEFTPLGYQAVPIWVSSKWKLISCFLYYVVLIEFGQTCKQFFTHTCVLSVNSDRRCRSNLEYFG
jgi:hypothetical protein